MFGEEAGLIFKRRYFTSPPDWLLGCHARDFDDTAARSIFDHAAARGMACASNDRRENLAVARALAAKNSPWLSSTTAEKMDRTVENTMLDATQEDLKDMDFSPSSARDVLVWNWMEDKNGITNVKRTTNPVASIVRAYKWSKKLVAKSGDGEHDFHRGGADSSFVERIMDAASPAKWRAGDFSKLVFSNEYLPVDITSRYVKRTRPTLVKAIDDAVKYKYENPEKRAVSINRIENIRESINSIIDELSTTGERNDDLKIDSPSIAEHGGEMLDLMVFDEIKDKRDAKDMMKKLVTRVLEKGSIGEMGVFLKKAAESDRKLFANRNRLEKAVAKAEADIEAKEKEHDATEQEISTLENETRHKWKEGVYEKLNEKRKLLSAIDKAENDLHDQKYKLSSDLDDLVPVISITKILRSTWIEYPASVEIKL